MTVLSVWPLGMALNAKMPQVFDVWGPNWPKRVWGLGHLPLWGACVGSVGHAKAGHFVTPVTCKKVVLTVEIGPGVQAMLCQAKPSMHGLYIGSGQSQRTCQGP